MANPAVVDIPCENLAREENFEEPPVLDLVHLSRQTFGDHALEVELLTLFERQAAHLAVRLGDPRRPGDSTARLELAHMLKGSAMSVGAFAVAATAQAYEIALRQGEPAEGRACGALVAKIDAARAAIAELL